MPMNVQEWLWSGLASTARAAAERTDNPDLQVRVLLEAARYKVLAIRAAESDRSDDSDEV